MRPDTFWTHVDESAGPEACWPWTAKRSNRGYGAVSVGEVRGAHRVAYTMAVGPIPPGLQIDHLCHDPRECAGGVTCPHRSCCNPAHMEPVSASENTRRGHAPRLAATLGLSKTECPAGHLLPPARPGRRRVCQLCRTQQAHTRAPRLNDEARISRRSGSCPSGHSYQDHGVEIGPTKKLKCDACRPTHCPAGHPYDLAMGKPKCRECHRRHSRESYYRRKALVAT